MLILAHARNSLKTKERMLPPLQCQQQPQLHWSMSVQMVAIHVPTMLFALMKSKVTCVSVTPDTKVTETFVLMLMNVQLIQKPVPKMLPVLIRKVVTHVPVMKVTSVMVWSEVNKRDAKTSMNARSAVEINVTPVPTAVILMDHTNANVQRDTLVMVSIVKTSTSAMDQTNAIPMHFVSTPVWQKTQQVTLASAKMVLLTHTVTDVSVTT